MTDRIPAPPPAVPADEVAGLDELKRAVANRLAIIVAHVPGATTLIVSVLDDIDRAVASERARADRAEAELAALRRDARAVVDAMWAGDARLCTCHTVALAARLGAGDG